METLQRSFTAGEISPALGARSDLNKYQTGLAKLLNGYVQPEGGVANRAGFEFIGYTPNNNAAVRLIPFQFNTEQTYVLVLTEGKMYFVTNAGYVVEPEQSIVSTTSASTALVTITGHGYQDGDEIIITGMNGESAPTADGIDPIGPKYDMNFRTFEISAATTDTFVPLDPETGIPINTQSYGGAPTGGFASRIYSIPHPYLQDEIADIRFTQSADVMTIVHPNHEPRELRRLGNDNWTLDIIDFTSAVAVPSISTVVDSGTTDTTNQRVYKYAVTALDEDGRESLLSAPVTTASIIALDVTRKNTISITPSVGAVSYNIYKAESESSNIYGFIGSTKTTTFEDYNFAPDISDAPPTDRNPFDQAGNYPSTVAYYQQRLVYGATNNKPETIEFSRISDYSSFRTSVPTKADDAITFTIADTQVNRVRHLVSVGALLSLTSGGEWKITEGQDQVLTPSTVSARQQSQYGSANIAPIIIDQSALFIQESGSRLRDIGYTFESDSYAGTDLSIMAQHLFKDFTITDMTFCQEPDRLVWLIRNDGKLLGLTYHKEHRITGWSQHDTQGSFSSCASVREGTANILYVSVQRTINGNTINTIERHKERDDTESTEGFFLDMARRYRYISPTSLIYHLDFLAGETVNVLADGKVFEGLQVNDRGVLELQEEASIITVGLPYNFDMETLEIDSGQRMIKGKPKSVGEVVFKFYRWRGGFVGPDENSLLEVKPREQSDNYDAIQLRSAEVRVSVDSTWTDGGKVFFRQKLPLPVTVLAIAPDVAVG